MAVGVSFQSAAKSCLIPSNGSLAPELFSAQPQKMVACAKMAFPACAGPLITALGAFDEQRKFVLRLSEKIPARPFLPYFQSAKLLRIIVSNVRRKRGFFCTQGPRKSEDLGLEKTMKRYQHSR
jgi:hypothetical protein